MKKQKSTIPGVAQSDIDASFAGPAILANRFFVTFTNAGMRIAFTEQSSPTAPAAFRTAAVMSMQDGIALKNLLTDLLAPVEKQMRDELERGGKENPG